MSKLQRFQRSALCAAWMLGLQPAVQADPARQMSEQYKNMCVGAANFPAGEGESDLKGNPKLGAYCDCFAEKFLARAMGAAKSGTMGTPTLDESSKQELAMRQECRQKTGLPRPPAGS